MLVLAAWRSDWHGSSVYHQRRLGNFFMEWYWHFILGEPEFLRARVERLAATYRFFVFVDP